MYLCVYTYIHTCIHTYIHTYIRTYIHTSIRAYIHTYIHTYIPTYIPTYLHTYIHTYIHRYIDVCTSELICVHITRCIYIYMYTSIRMYIHTYITHVLSVYQILPGHIPVLKSLRARSTNRIHGWTLWEVVSASACVSGVEPGTSRSKGPSLGRSRTCLGARTKTLDIH